MSTIWKYHLHLPDDPIVIYMPKGARVLHIGQQAGLIKMWALVDPEADTEKRTFAILGTGGAGPESTDLYLGTVQLGSYVWHVFERVQLDLSLKGDDSSEPESRNP